MLPKRQELIDLGVLAQQGSDYTFTQEFTFISPSTAACVVLGSSANGRLEWKDAQGRALKVLQGGVGRHNARCAPSLNRLK
jgi:hypothetical protein